jgi:hypothetical protein
VEPTIRAVTCPCCRNFLFALEQVSDGGEWKITKDSPVVQKDAEGNFMKCSNCSKRVAVEKIAVAKSERWTVSASQKCDRVLP